MLVNIPSLGPGQTGPRFLWVTYADGLLFPFVSDQGAIQAMEKKFDSKSQSVAFDFGTIANTCTFCLPTS